MPDNGRSNGSGVAIVLFTGLAIGAIFGILFAPKSGKETRAQIKETASDIIEKAKDKASEMRHTVACKIDDNPDNC